MRSKMGDVMENLSDYLSKIGYVACNDYKKVLPKFDLNEHRERDHEDIHHSSNSDPGSEVVDGEINVLKGIKPENRLNPFIQMSMDTDGHQRTPMTPPRPCGRNQFFANWNRENISPDTPSKKTSPPAIEFPVKQLKRFSFVENIDDNSDKVNEAVNLIDFNKNGYDGDNGENIEFLKSKKDEHDASNGVLIADSNPFRIKQEQPFDLINFKWNSVAGQSVVNAKNNANDDDESVHAVLSTSIKSEVQNTAVNVIVPKAKPTKNPIINSKRKYFVKCRECKNIVLADGWSNHMKNEHKINVDQDCVPDCVNDNMKFAFCKKCKNIMPKYSFSQHNIRKHRSNVIGSIALGGPNDEKFNDFVRRGKIFANDGLIYFKTN